MPEQWNLSSSGRQVEQKFLRKVVKVVCDKGATYPSEVASRCSHDPGEVGELMRQLKKSGFLEELSPKMKHSDKRLLNRRNDIEGGIKEFKKRNWYGLNSDLEWSFRDRNRDIYVNEYHNHIANPDPNRKSVIDRAVDMLEEVGEM